MPSVNTTLIPVIGINGELKTENHWMLLALLIGVSAIVIGVYTTHKKK